MLSENEKKLLKKVAFWLRDEMVRCLSDSVAKPDLLYDEGQSNFEISCIALERVGILTAEGNYYRVNQSQTEQSILNSQYTRTDLDYLLDALVCHSTYVTDLYQHPISPNDNNLKSVCHAMADCSYMCLISPNTFVWADDFAPWLIRHGIFNLDEFEEASEDEVNRALATIPDKAKENLSASLCSDQSDFVRCFFAQWIDGEWMEDEWRDTPSDDWDLNLAAGIYAQLHSQ